jgi:hypothetical protein
MSSILRSARTPRCNLRQQCVTRTLADGEQGNHGCVCGGGDGAVSGVHVCRRRSMPATAATVTGPVLGHAGHLALSVQYSYELCYSSACTNRTSTVVGAIHITLHHTTPHYKHHTYTQHVVHVCMYMNTYSALDIHVTRTYIHIYYIYIYVHTYAYTRECMHV